MARAVMAPQGELAGLRGEAPTALRAVFSGVQYGRASGIVTVARWINSPDEHYQHGGIVVHEARARQKFRLLAFGLGDVCNRRQSRSSPATFLRAPHCRLSLFGKRSAADPAEKCWHHFGGMLPDHVHLCVKTFQRGLPISAVIMNQVKGRFLENISFRQPTRPVFQDDHPFRWQEGYGVFSVGQSNQVGHVPCLY